MKLLLYYSEQMEYGNEISKTRVENSFLWRLVLLWGIVYLQLDFAHLLHFVLVRKMLI
jgi:hypothetical protein